MKEDIRERVKRVLREKFTDSTKQLEIKDDTPLFGIGVGVDSVATLEFVIALEHEFQISIDEGEIKPEILATVDTISEFIATHVLKKSG
ncbi:Acyl carrier protein [bacterium HR37]|nr:Acyl carrier protein [bacterium HR37]